MNPSTTSRLTQLIVLSALSVAVSVSVAYGGEPLDEKTPKTEAPEAPASVAAELEALVKWWDGHEEITPEITTEMAEKFQNLGNDAVPDLMKFLEANRAKSIGGPLRAALSQTGDDKVYDLLVRHFGDAKSSTEKVSIIQALGEFGEPDTINVIMPAVATKDSKLSVAAMKVLQELTKVSGGHATLFQAIEEFYEDSEALRPRLVCIGLLRSTNTTDSREFLADLLRDESVAVRRESLRSLGFMKAGGSIALRVRNRLRDADDTEKAHVCEALGRMQDVESISEIIPLVESENKALKISALWALKNITQRNFGSEEEWLSWWEPEQERAQDLLQKYLPKLKENGAAARNTVRLLATLVSERESVLGELVDHTDHDDAAVRQEIARVLGQIGRLEHSDDLIGLLNDDEASVRQEAWRSLKKVTGESWPNEHRDWYDWWQERPR
jgi:HEAT repeat protein